MLKTKKLRTAFLFLPFVFCLFLSGVSVADDSCFQGLSTIPGNAQYGESWLLQWDPNNPDELDRNNSVTISVTHGRPLYTWDVSENGFSLSQSQTTGLSNILYADNAACGTATITVADDFGGVITGYVRCTTGVWSEDCSARNTANCDKGAADVYFYVDGKRITIETRCLWSHAGRDCWFFKCGGYDSANYIPDGTVCRPIFQSDTACPDELGGVGYTCVEGETTNCCYLNLGIVVESWVCP